MAALDILPPAAPTAKPEPRKGIFNRIFKRSKEREPSVSTPSDQLASFDTLEDKAFDLDEIKRKIGIEDEQAAEPEHIKPKSSAPPMPDPFVDLPIEQPITFEASVSQQVSSPSIPRPDSRSDSYKSISLFDEELPELPKHSAPPAALEEDLSWTQEMAKPGSAGPDWATPAEKDDSEWLSPPQKYLAPEEEAPTPPIPESPEIPSIDANKQENKQENKQDTSDWSAPEPEFPEVPPIPVLAAEEQPNLAASLFSGLEEEHAKLEREIGSLLKEPALALPAPEHPLKKQVPAGEEFILKNGQPLKNYQELLEMLEVIEPEVFFHHVSVDKNDFANWLRHVFKEEKLADDIKNITSRKELLKALQHHGKKVEKQFLAEEKKIDQSLKSRKEKLARAAQLHGRLADLKVELAKKSSELADDRKIITKDVNKRVVAEMERRLKGEQRATVQAITEAERTRKEYERRINAVGKALDKREARVREKEDDLKQLQSKLEEERHSFIAERSEAGPLLAQAAEIKKQQQALAGERTRLEDERQRLFTEREQLAKEKRDIGLQVANTSRRESAIEKERATLAVREAALQKKEGEIRQQQQEFLRLKSGFEEQEKKVRASEQKRLAELQAEERLAAEKEKKARAAEEKLSSELKERRKIARYIEEAEQKITEQQDRLEKGSFQKHVERLKSLREDDLPSPKAVKNLKIYTMIDKARQLIDHGELSEARELYSRIRETFNKERLSPSEKAVLYTTIRELYDDIHLASLKK